MVQSKKPMKIESYNIDVDGYTEDCYLIDNDWSADDFDLFSDMLTLSYEYGLPMWF